MAKNITLMGADYPNVPAVQLPQTGGGTATFYDMEPTIQQPTMVASRVSLLAGGYCKIGRFCFFNMTFKAIATASNSPQIATIDNTTLTSDAAMSCIDITSGIGSAITGSVPAGIGSNGRIYAKEIITDHIYALSGVCVMS